MPRYVNAAELRRRWDDASYGPQRVVRELRESLEDGRAGKAGALRADHFSIRDLIEHMVPNGREFLDAMSYRRSGGGHRLQEAIQAVDTSAFSQILDPIFHSRVLERYNAPELIWPQLCETIPTTKLKGQRIPGVGGIGDQFDANGIGEGDPYPVFGVNQQWVDTGPLVKRGGEVRVTREIAVEDDTGQVMRECSALGDYMGINKEKRVVDLAIGVTNNYKRNGTAYDTYQATTPYINYDSTNSLTDYTSIDRARRMFQNMTDPNTGEPIVIGGGVLLVPQALEIQANVIVRAQTIERVDNTVSASTIRTTSGNPLPAGLSVLSSPYVYLRTSSATRWFYGEPKKAIGYMEAWAIETDQLGAGSALHFHNDIIAAWKASEMGLPQMLEPRYLTRNNT